jgi:hypothetical protein
MHAEDNDLNFGIAAEDLGRRIDTVQHWHGDVHHDYIGPQFSSQANGLAPIGSLSDDRNVRRLFEQCAQALADNPVVIRY